MPVALVGETSSIRFGQLDSVLVVQYTGQVGVPAMNDLALHYQRMAAKYPRFTAFHVSGTVNDVTFEPGLREASVEVTKKFDPHFAALAIVIVAPGFAGALVRSFLASWVLLSRPKSPQRIFGTIPPAADWVRVQTGQPPELLSRVDLGPSIEAFCSASPAPAPRGVAS